MMPGDVFVHRNIANCVVHTDLNCLSVISYAIEVLKVKYVIVCGHYGCGGVRAALQEQSTGLPEHCFRNIRDVRFKKQEVLNAIEDAADKLKSLCELNVQQQVANVTYLPAIQKAWKGGVELSVHGWIYDIKNGLLKRLVDPVVGIEQVAPEYRL